MQISSNNIYTFRSWLTLYWPSLLVLFAFFGFISKSLFQYPVAIMAFLGLYILLTQPVKIWRDEAQKHFIILFLCLWAPLLISFFDAYNMERAARTVFPYLRFLFAGIFIIETFGAKKERLHFLACGLVFLVSFWCIDATIQFFIGRDLFGYPGIPGQTPGMFYPEIHLPHVCSALSIFLFLFVYKRINRSWWPLLLLLPLFFIILLAGRRATWLMLALNSLGFLFYIFITSSHKVYLLKITAGFSLVVVILITGTVFLHEPTQNRLMTTLDLFSDDYDKVDKATARRLPIWETSVNIIKTHPINGIGPRGFRYAYKDYASPGNYWRSQTHPHLLILEVLTETGIIGVIGYIFLWFMLIRLYLRVKQKAFLFPYLLATLVALFPFNAHMAFFGSIWSSMCWLLIILFIVQYKLMSGDNDHISSK